MQEQKKKLIAIAEELISITDAAEGTPYSAEYLSLLARKGRIPAVKIARDWLTTKEAIKLYIEQQKLKHLEFQEKAESMLNSKDDIN